MKLSYALVAVIAMLAISGCASQQQMLNNDQSEAVQTAVNRARFDMGCPSATGVVISQEVVQPAMQGPYVNGIRRAEFTVGVEGCGRRKSYIVICPQGGDGCFAAGPGRFHQDWQ
jgi:hypothetical protein